MGALKGPLKGSGTRNIVSDPQRCSVHDLRCKFPYIVSHGHNNVAGPNRVYTSVTPTQMASWPEAGVTFTAKNDQRMGRK